ncbi:MAG: beta-propeller domain-containing protein [Lachnospiraceae bacterium]|nr:beta-propeller domain-containing protein [Lachnospiraceae bacterium]
MNEQELMNKIDETTKNIPIPDSISPENMKKMLDEEMHDWNAFDRTTDKNSDNSTSTQTKTANNAVTKLSTSNRNRIMRRLTVAACLVLCFVVGGTAIHLGSRSQLQSDTTESAAYEEAAEESMDIAESAEAEEESKSADTASTTAEELVVASSLQSPSSYEDYYETLTTAYQAYYDNIATVTTDELTDGLTMEDSFQSSTEAGLATNEAVAESATVTGSAAEKEMAADLDSSLRGAGSGEESNADFSTTNTQEKEVDEGDVIKTDGKYIYKIISKFNGDIGYTIHQLTITETDNGNLKVLGTIDLSEGTKPEEDVYLDFKEFYLYDNYLVALFAFTDYSGKHENTTRITLYDISDKENPKRVRTLTQSGNYESSRISDGYLYTISNFYEANLDTPTPYSNYIPSINGTTMECEDIYYPDNVLIETTYVVTSLNLDNPEDFTDTAAIPTNGGQVYVSDSSIYFYTTLYDHVTKTEIVKVNYDKGILTPGENAIITGYLYDSFALSEYDGHLRIVATIPANNISLLRTDLFKVGSANTEDTTENVVVKEDVNVLYILDKDMKLTGKISGIAPGEQIYSARFMGDIGYFVTFKTVDPLFSVDLSDPTNPKIIGQLKIPGFSNYLHAYEDGLLLGLGEEYDPNTMDYLGLKLSMFDISDPANVTEQDKYIIENSTYTDAQYNHKALMIDPKKNLFGFLYGSSDGVNYKYTHYYATYTYDEEKGFIETARYEITDGSENEIDAVRGVYIGNYFYLVTNKSVTSYEIGSTTPIAQVHFR